MLYSPYLLLSYYFLLAYHLKFFLLVILANQPLSLFSLQVGTPLLATVFLTNKNSTLPLQRKW